MEAKQKNWAMYGRVTAEVEGAGPEAVGKLMDTLGKELTIDLAESTDEALLNAYLRRAIAAESRGKFPEIRAALDAAQDPTAETLKVAAKYKINVKDIQARKLHLGYRDNAGNILHERHDTTTPAWKAFERDHVLIHSNTGGMDNATLVDTVLTNGGWFTSTADKMRRGIPVGGMSPDADMASGGADYFFTRINNRADVGRTDFIFKSTAVRRLDAVSYDADRYGRTTADENHKHRKWTPDQLAAASGKSSNETIFRDGLDLLSNIERIHSRGDPAIRTRTIEVFKKHGITTLPDGRKIEDIVVL